jgi:hypothetical protein
MASIIPPQIILRGEPAALGVVASSEDSENRGALSKKILIERPAMLVIPVKFRLF